MSLTLASYAPETRVKLLNAEKYGVLPFGIIKSNISEFNIMVNAIDSTSNEIKEIKLHHVAVKLFPNSK
jgi:hypothetical protein